MISIVLPVYNGAKYLQESVESILRQTYQDFELIIVDDCSTDDTMQIVKEFVRKDARIRVVCNKENLKLPKSLNVGFSYCRGEYYTWTSDDNIYENKALEVLLQKIEQGFDIVWSDYARIDTKGKLLGKTSLSACSVDEILLYDIVGACFLYKREVQDALEGYCAEKFLVEDYDFWIRAYLKGFQFASVNQTLYRYRVHTKSLTGTRLKDIQKKTVQLVEANIFAKLSWKTKSRICCEIVMRAEAMGGSGCFYRLVYVPLAYFFSPSTAKKYLGFLRKRG